MTARNIIQIGEPYPRHLNHLQRILVAEDMEGIRHLNTEVLAGSGYKVDAVADGAIAWDALQQKSYDLLVTDHQMPEITGIELLQKLRAARMALPVILVSGTMPIKELNRHPWLQVDATLLKPYTPHELLATVKKVLYATDGTPERAASPNWQDQMEADYLRPYSIGRCIAA